MIHARSAFLAVALGVALVTAAHLSAETTFERHAFPLPQAIFAVDAIDTNHDGQLDLIAVGPTKVWSLVAPQWHPVELVETPAGMTIHAVSLDCDGDGDLDLVLGRASSAWIEFRAAQAEGKAPREPEGADFTVAWIENRDTNEANWPLHILDRELHGVHGLARGDVNRDGTVDLLADSFAGPHLESSLAWFAVQPAATAPRSGMPRHLITRGRATGRPHYMDFADVNGDGRGDVLLGASTEGSITWWEQPQDLAAEWARHVIAWRPGATHPRAADLDGDGQPDVLASAGHGEGVYWYQAPSWTEHTIDGSVRDVHAFDAADLDGDGDIDCAGCSFSQEVTRWWENRGHGRFRGHDLDVGNHQQAYDLKIVDLDQDGRLDILLAGRATENVVWYRHVASD